jgi:molybdopterin-guanine dinucleotide biosynthesis adapter protein
MKVVGFSGFSGAGKTTLMEKLIRDLKMRGLRVSVIKHAHHGFDIDQSGKDSFRHREAGALEVMVASNKRLALMREFESEADLNVHHLLAQLCEGVDWVLVEGFRQSDVLKIEVHRPSAGKPALYNDDDFIVAIATDAPQAFEGKTLRPVLDINSADAVAQWLLDHADRFEYHAKATRSHWIQDTSQRHTPRHA